MSTGREEEIGNMIRGRERLEFSGCEVESLVKQTPSPFALWVETV